MKTLTAAAVVLAGAIAIGTGTAARAEEKKNAPEPGTYQYQYALEAGSLPATGDSAVRGSESKTAEPVRTYEVSGRTYRAGIDDGP